MTTKYNLNFPTVCLPFGDTIASYFQPKSDIDVLKSSLLIFVMTSFGERVMENDIGTSIPRSVFEPIDPTFDQETIKDEIRNIVKKYDPRIDVTDVRVELNDDLKTVLIKILAQPFQDPEKQFSLDFQLTR